MWIMGCAPFLGRTRNLWRKAPARLEGAEFSQLVARYAQRQISLDTFLAQAAQTARLMQGE